MGNSKLERLEDFIEHELFQELSDLMIYLGLGLVIVLIGLYFGIGVRTVESTNQCEQQISVCHGIRTNGQCVGIQSNDTAFAPPSQCKDYEYIEWACEGGAKSYFQTDSMKNVQILDRTCAEWAEIYDLNISANKER